jgi:hypothetical protein
VHLLKRHGLSLTVLGILALWIVLYAISDPKTHTGAFFDNAIADWSGSAAVIVLTKFLYEKRSSESKKPPPERRGWKRLVYDHSLSIVLSVTGSIVSEWLQMLGLVILTKRFVEIGSKESS